MYHKGMHRLVAAACFCGSARSLNLSITRCSASWGGRELILGNEVPRIVAHRCIIKASVDVAKSKHKQTHGPNHKGTTGHRSNHWKKAQSRP
jgi:hypothetical protein